MSDQEIAISVKKVSKSFNLPHEQHSGIKQVITNAFKKNKIRGYETQNVLDDISFDVKKGDFFGIVGRNGSGKSTLLKLISEIYVPDKGSIQVNGSLTPFIELGVGFNPELTGRENVYMNGALLGFSNLQMDVMYDEIVGFAELERFMDQKLKNYSSGMQVRLAFSIAIRAESDILVLDEVLAVGDEAFQRKCNDYFNKIRSDKNKTVVLVTHDMGAVKKYCNRAVFIKNGKIIFEGDPQNVANEYTLENASVATPKSKDSKPKHNGVENLKVKLLSNKSITENEEIKFEIEYDTTKNMQTIPALSITDVHRNVWIQNDNMWDSIIEGVGHHKISYSCKLPEHVNDCVVKIQMSVWSNDEKMLAFIDENNTPKVSIRRSDVKGKRDTGIASGLLHTKGKWEIKNDK